MTRMEIGNVNAELQESISAVREVQAFNRADENIQNFRKQRRQPRCQRAGGRLHQCAGPDPGGAWPMWPWPVVTGVGGCTCSRQAAVRHDRVAGSGHHLPGLRPALQPAHPADRRAVGQYSERHGRRRADLQPAGRKAGGAETSPTRRRCRRSRARWS